MDKTEILFLPHSKTVQAGKGAYILDAARDAFMDIESSCNGKGTCGKCAVQVVEGPMPEPHHDEIRHITEKELEEGVRLACRTRAVEKTTVRILERSGERHKILEDGILPPFSLNPNIRKQVQDGNKKTTLVYSNQRIIGMEPGETASQCYGVAVDIGTTTVVASLVDLLTGDELGTASQINPQKNYGLDVLTRIHYIREHPGGLEKLGGLIRDCVNGLVGKVAKKSGVERVKIYEVVVAANAAMMHIFLGVDPAGLGRAPYTPAFTSSRTVSSLELGLEISPFGEVFCLPGVSAYIGADVVGGLLATELDRSDGAALFIDIGTNGEIVLLSGRELHACSCAAGPALEGMNISSGMRAADGAIEKMLMNGDVETHTIGNKPPKGLCGSGVMDAVGELLKSGIVAGSGRFNGHNGGHSTRALAQRIKRDKSGVRFVLAVNEKTGKEVAITQKDIRQVQLAKGAVLSGILALCSRLRMDMESIDRVYLAGAFGRHIRLESVARLGILPGGLLNKVILAGNTSKAGAVLCLLSREKRQEALSMSEKVQYMELSNYQDYDRLFVRCLSLP